MYRVSVDVGGTFTDLVALDEVSGEIINIKTPSVPKNPEQGVVNAVNMFLGEHPPGSIKMIGHATTIATNALFGQVDLELPRTGLLTTSGFQDVIEIGRQRRAEVYNLFFERPPMLVKRRHRYIIKERISPKGVIEGNINHKELESIIQKIREDRIESLAVGFINSYANTTHETFVKEALLKAIPGLQVTASHEISNEYREYERFSTAVVNAALMPVIHTYITQLEEDLNGLGLDTQLYVMQSNGGLARSNVVSMKPATIVESGPAAGVIAAAWLGEMTGVRDIISFDMGGTTAKVGTVRGRIPEVVPEYEVAGTIHMGRLVKGSGYPVRFPFIDLAECSAGGGTIAREHNGSLQVGPISAGALPGPACYGRGGSEATITDANLVLGRLNPGELLGGEMKVHPGNAEKVYRELGSRLGVDEYEAAVSVIRIANSMMGKILRIVSVERGYDPRDFSLVAFGGAGPMHVCALAEELEINRVMLPRNPGMFSALGLLTADLFHDYSNPVLSETDDVDSDSVEELFLMMEERGRGTLELESVPESRHRFLRTLDMRYRGQGFELNVETSGRFTVESIKDVLTGFHGKHMEVYGYMDEGESVEIVNAKLRAIGLLETPGLVDRGLMGRSNPRETRRVYFESLGDWADTGVYDRRGLGKEVEGPAIVEQYDSTTVVYPGWTLRQDCNGIMSLRRIRK
ncbi:hydantoinase/oxoprolinase family protein [Candidatus Bathyarchaeota archaeon]|jgi:N-methylhydantoinase A|nr:hydantoinase/oxoprolinase family protein [Candidatus Bathyarchaeota archaeon]MBT4320587.1 hydantoinase/oxoprolinase family protein [Candidatus Bathyarchaeota archaeon]MBT4423537.1 hydantoinase/oxoprolinase family protein [Candidatus Bathyarchaeota archaeon]MBT6604189.1 hydantoinase/oxoprolinase family protein [Candidatus Bathyarchaeota archaeon]MBT7188460.1 hydantoinase/oxoprolinase family protein [Candidatus Bathyarchaeota archaeon]